MDLSMAERKDYHRRYEDDHQTTSVTLLPVRLFRRFRQTNELRFLPGR